MLLLATLMWSTSSVALRWLVGDGGVEVADSVILAVRFTLACGLILLWKPQLLRERGTNREWLITLWLGVLMGLTYFTQQRGLATIGAARSHFITNLTVVLVPIMQVVVMRRRPPAVVFGGAVLAMVGLALLTDPRGTGIVIGDVWTLATAVIYGVYMIELQRLGSQVPLHRLLLGQFIVIAVGFWIFGAARGELTFGEIDWRSWALIVYLAIFCSFVALLLHNRYQRDTTPSRAALLFASGPVMTTGLSWIILGETLMMWQLVGAGLILAAIVTVELLGSRRSGEVTGS